VKEGVPYFTKAGTIIRCSICGKSGHNKKGHQTYLLSQQQQMEGVVWEDEEIDIPSIVEVVVMMLFLRCFLLNLQLLTFFISITTAHLPTVSQS
jgi:hypothetical protein